MSMADAERQQIAQLMQHAPPPGAALDPAAVAKQFSLLTQSGAARAKEYEPFSRQSAMQQQQQQQSLRDRQQAFFKFLVGVLHARGQALPGFLVAPGVAQTLPYDPATSPFSWFEPGSVAGAFRLADKDVDVFKLWTLVTNAGGSQKLTAENAWGRAAQLLDLPLQLSQPHPATGTPNTGDVIQKAYFTLLGTLEHAYIQRMRAAAMAKAQAGGAGSPGMGLGIGTPDGMQGQQQPQAGPSGMQMSQLAQPGSMPFGGAHSQSQPQMPSHTPSHSQDGMENPFNTAGAAENDEKKRKSDEDEERDVKKMKMDPTFEMSSLMASPERDPNSQSPQRASTMDAEAKARTIPTRNKIEYVPIRREMDTFGGRDLDAIEHELQHRMRARPARSADEWGQVDVEGLSLSLRSRVSSEVGYALTTLLYLSFMRSSVPNRGFPLGTSGELCDDLLDLLEETAFGPGYDGLGIGLGERRPPPAYPVTEAEADATRTWTDRELVNFVHEAGSNLFAALDEDPTRERARGPLPRRADIILAVLGIFRNLAPLEDNIHICAQHPRLTDLMLRVCALDPPCAPRREKSPLTAPRPYSDALTLKDLIEVRKEVVQVLVCYCNLHSLEEHSPHTTRMLMDLLASYIVDPEDAISPSQLVHALGEKPSSTTVRPPWKTDTALEVLSRITLHDPNRYQVARHVPQTRVQELFHALVHMLPVVEQDFLVTYKAAWLLWTEKVVFCLYSLAFLASPELKMRLKADRRLGFSGIMLRLIKRYTVGIPPDWREWFPMLAHRAVELAKVVDDAEDLFKTPAETGGAILGFGMGGYGETSVQRVEKGTGMFGGHQEDVTWTLLNTPGAVDDIMFSELDSLARLG